MADEPSMSGEAGQRHGPGCGCPRCAGFQPGNEHAFEPGNEVPLKHGVYSERRLIAAAEQEYAQLRSTFTPWDPAYDLPARTLAEIRARTVLAYRWLDEHDLVDDQHEVRAILKELPRWERRAIDLFRELAMTVKSRAELARTEAEAEMLSLGEWKQVEAAYQAAVRAVLPGELADVFIRELRLRLEQLFAAPESEVRPAVIEGAARRLDPGSDPGAVPGEEDPGGA